MARSPLVRRYREIVRVLIRYGLVDVVEALGLRRYLALGARLLPARVAADASLSREARFRLTLEALGPTFVKFGQALSVRGDLLPPSLVAELSALQDQAAPLEAGVAERVVEAELRRPLAAVFRRFETSPLARASMAVVHRAELSDGTPVAVKIGRPGIDAVIARDLDVLRQLARLVERHVSWADVVGPSRLVDEFAQTIHAEQNFVREGRNIERCRRNFDGDPTVKVPAVYWAQTTPRVLTLEYIDGFRLTDSRRVALEPAVRRAIAERGANALLRQVLVHGFFHADPHPGNLIILDGPVIGFLDFGIVGRLDERTRADLAKVVRAIARRDAEALAALAVDMTRPEHDVDIRALTRDLGDLVDAYADVPLGQLSLTEVLGDIVSTASRYRLRFPANLMLLIKAIVTIESVGRDLDPEFRLVEHAAPIAEPLWASRYTAPALVERAADALHTSMQALSHLPVHIEQIARKAGEGRWQVQFVHRNLEHFIEEMDRAGNRIGFSVVIGSLVIGSSLILQGGSGAAILGYPALGLVGFIVAGFLGIGLAIGIVRSGKL